MKKHIAHIVFCLLATVPLATFAQLKPWPKQNDSLPNTTHYFYKNEGYGSMALFNPISYVVNGGYDILQLRNNDDRIFRFPYAVSAKNVFVNLGRPDKAIKDMGLWKWTKQEVLPLTFTQAGAQWVPNYFLHLVGGGMYYSMLTEWYRDHNVPQPVLMAIITHLACDVLNETMENQGHVGTNEDPIPDMYIFNVAGILMFTSPKVCKFFSEQLNMTDWSSQATITLPRGSIENQGEFYAVKYALPFYKPLRLFARMGSGSLVGLSYRFNDGYSISAGGGIRPDSLALLDIKARQVTINSKLSAGLFIDRNNSLLASVVISDTKDYFIQANVYPGLLKIGNFTPGLWTVIGRDGYLTFGITSIYTFGIGIGGEIYPAHL